MMVLLVPVVTLSVSQVAVERGDEVLVELDGEFTLEPDDAVYVCGTQDAVAQYYEVFPGARG